MTNQTPRSHGRVSIAPASTCILASLAFACFSVQSNAQPAPEPGVAKPVAITDRIIVKYRDSAAAGVLASAPGTAAPDVRESARRSRLQRKFGEATFALGVEKKTSFGAKVLSLGRMAGTTEVQQLAQRLMDDDADIEYAVPDHFIYISQTPSDPRYAQQWSLNDVNAGVRAESAWTRFNMAARQSRDAPNWPLVAIIDTGYRPHVDLAPPSGGFDYVTGNLDPLDTGDGRTANQCANAPGAQASSWHGLNVEGIIAAQTNNGVGIAGVSASAAGILHARVFGPCGGYLSSYIDAIRDSVDHRTAQGQRVRVINLSQGSSTACEAPLQAEISRAIDAGVAVVVSAGNYNADVATSSPANCTGVISVAATDRFGNRARYSNFGSGVTLSAPGGDNGNRAANDGVLTATLNLPGTEPTGQESSDYTYVQGTSFSAPHVSAAAALLFNLNPSLTPAQVKRVLTDTARPLPGNCAGGCGAGLLDLNAAIEKVERKKGLAKICSVRWPFSVPMCAGYND